MLESVGALVGGLGLFLLGVKGLSGHLVSLAGPRTRLGLERGTRSLVSASLVGLALGAMTQSSNLVTFIAASMRAANVVGMRRIVPLLGWANVGTAGLVLVASFDLKAAALWLVGLCGLATYLMRDGEGRARTILAATTGLCLMLLGLGLLKGAAGPLQDMPWLREALTPGMGTFLLVFLGGAAITLVAQSSSTVSILAIALHGAGLGSFEQAAIAICGASFGSGLAALTMRRGLRGTALQPVFCQVFLRSAGAALFVILIGVEQVTGLPLLLAGVAMLAEQPDVRLALVFLALQVAAALLAVPLLTPLERMLDRLSPADAAEIGGQPRFLFPQALADAPSALPLLRAEQGRLLDRLPPMLEGLCEAGQPYEPGSGSAELEEAIRDFHAALVARELPHETLSQALALGARLDALVALRETLAEFAAVGLDLSQPANGLQLRVQAMAEALHLLLEEARAITSAQDAAWLAELAADRGEMMQRIRREAAGAAQAGMFRLTGLFERAVWLVRRLALLEGEAV